MPKLLCRKKICGQCKALLPVKSFGICRARPDKRNLYCKACVLEKVHTYRKKVREMKSAQNQCREVLGLPERKPVIVARSLSLKETIKLAIKSGCKTRDEIYSYVRQTIKVNWDEFGDRLAELTFESHEVLIVRTGSERELHLAA